MSRSLEVARWGLERQAAVLALTALIAFGCIPWVQKTGGSVWPERHVDAFGPEEDVGLLPVWYDHGGCALRHPLFVKGKSLEVRRFSIESRRKLGTMDWMGHGGPAHFGTGVGLLYLSSGGLLKWHLADDSIVLERPINSADRAELWA